MLDQQQAQIQQQCQYNKEKKKTSFQLEKLKGQFGINPVNIKSLLAQSYFTVAIRQALVSNTDTSHSTQLPPKHKTRQDKTTKTNKQKRK